MTNTTLNSNGFDIETLALGDERLRVRFRKVLALIESSPAASFPAIFKKKMDLAGFYRLMNNRKMDHNEIFKNAFSVTQQKAKEHSKVIVVHDTTQFVLDEGNSPYITGIGRISGKKRGFFGHFSLAITPEREAVGLLGFKYYTRPQEKIGSRSHAERRKDPNCESNRWFELIQQSQERLLDHPNVVHVADREADDYLSYCRMLEGGIRFVFRVQHDRNVLGQEKDKLFTVLKMAPVIVEREVPLSRRKKSEIPASEKRNPQRQKRIAQLGIATQKVEVHRPTNVEGRHPKSLLLNFVVVTEINPPEGEKPVSWRLVTSESIETEDDLLKIVDIYRARWSIEEYFKAVKSGCSYEDRQFESVEAFLRCLALLAVIACNVYQIKMLARESPDKAALSSASPAQLQILQLHPATQLKSIRTVADFMWAVAQLGGHIKYNGTPGWQVLMRGYEELQKLEEGWNLALTQFSLPTPNNHVRYV